MKWGSEGHDDYIHPNCYFQVNSILIAHVVGIVIYPAEGHVGHKDEKLTQLIYGYIAHNHMVM